MGSSAVSAGPTMRYDIHTLTTIAQFVNYVLLTVELLSEDTCRVKVRTTSFTPIGVQIRGAPL